MTYKEKLRHPKWQKRRLQILSRDNFTCKLCGDDTTTLHVHHNKYSGEPWEAPDSDLICYCLHCHKVKEELKESPNVIIKEIAKEINPLSGEFDLSVLTYSERKNLHIFMFFKYLGEDAPLHFCGCFSSKFILKSSFLKQ